MTTPTDHAATSALIDQALAAAAETGTLMHAIGTHAGSAPQVLAPGPITRTIHWRLHATMLARALAGQPTACPHISPVAPAPAAWLAWAPDLLRCAPCAGDESRRIAGTELDRRCDHCGAIEDTIHPVVVQLPPIVLHRRPPHRPICMPPVLMHFGLCPPCFDTNHPEASP